MASSHRNRGFTLFEVAVSLLAMALGVLTISALLPRSLEQLNLARQRVYASAIAMELSTQLTYGYLRNNKTRGDHYHLSKIANAPDLERIANSYLSSAVDYRNMAPVPPEILLRLDSDDDLLRALVRDGIPVFYPLPRLMDATRPPGAPAPEGAALDAQQIADSAFESQGAELGQIIFAVVGDPQLNADWNMQHHTLLRDPGEMRIADPVIGLGRGWPWYTGGGYSDSSGTVRGASDNTNVATATVKFPTGNTRGVLPRKGYFWDHPVRVLDHYQAWPTWTQNTGGNSLNLGFDPATGGGPGLAPRAAAGLKYNHPEDRGLPVRNDPALKVGETDSLFQPFAPAERCRQIVFWSVNWKGYEDAEEAMPMDWDISAFNTGAPGSHERHSSQGWNDGVGHPEVATVRSDAAAKSFGLLWRRLGGVDAQPRASRTDAVFVQAPAVAWTGGSFNYADIFLAVRGEQLAGSRPGSPHVPEPITGNPTGNWWFDRNFNGRRDVGPIPRGTRLRARSIARFNAYDPRLFMVLR